MSSPTPSQPNKDLKKLQSSLIGHMSELFGTPPEDFKERVRSINEEQLLALKNKPIAADIYSCPYCHDDKRVRLSDDKKHPYFGKSFPCPKCVSVADRVRACGVPIAYRDWNLSQLDFDPTFIQTLQEQVVAGESLIMFGRVGRGKTHAAIGLLHHWLEQESEGAEIRPAKFIYFPHYLDEMRERMGDNSDNQNSRQYENELASYHLLVIDDLGAERTTEWSKERTTLLIDRRLRDGKQTIITTNLMSLGATADRYGDRTASRLSAYRWKECQGIDHRQRR